MEKVFIIPNLVFGIKLKDRPVNFIAYSIHIEYTSDSDWNIENSFLEKHVSESLGGLILVSASDKSYGMFHSLTESGELNCASYDNDYEDELDVSTEFTYIVKDNLNDMLKGQSLIINNISLNY